MRYAQRVSRVVSSGDAIVVLCLGGRGGSSGGLSMVLMARLLVDPGRLDLGTVVMLSVDVLTWHHLEGMLPCGYLGLGMTDKVGSGGRLIFRKGDEVHCSRSRVHEQSAPIASDIWEG